MEESSGVATLSLNRPPVNSLSLELLLAISTSIQQVESNPSIQSLILTSSLPSILSAGLDITELHDPDSQRLSAFWTAFQQVYLDLYASRLACMAAIVGHAPAAGCMLALSCDYRIMAAAVRSSSSSNMDTETNKVTIPKIGLNETKLGIAAPPWLGQLLVDTIGTRQAELSLSLGLLYSPQEALDIALVDEVVPQGQTVLERAHDEAVRCAAIPSEARVASKVLTRQRRVDQLLATRQQDTDDFCDFVQQEPTQRNLSAYLESLNTKGQK